MMPNKTLMFLLLALLSSQTAAMVFPHRDFSPHLERGKPGRESFGTVLAEEPVLDVALPEWIERYSEFSLPDELGIAEEAEGGQLLPLRQQLSHLKALLSRYELDSPERVEIYSQLAALYAQLDETDEAIDHLSRAQNIIHRNHGALHPDQLPLVYAKVELLGHQERIRAAEHQLRLAIKINEQHHGKNSDEALSAIQVTAAWLRDHEEYRRALTLYRQALKSITPQSGEDTPEMIPLLKGMAITFLLEQTAESDRGLTLHRRIAAIAKQHADQLPVAKRVQLLMDYADWSLMFGRRRDAWEQYREAWELSRQDPDGVAEWDRYFAQPRLIFSGPNLTLDFMGYQYVGKDVFYDFEFEVDPQGRPRRVEVLDSNLHGVTRARAVDFLRLGRYRPAIINGEPVNFQGIQHRRSYPTDPPDGFGEVRIGGFIGFVRRR